MRNNLWLFLLFLLSTSIQAQSSGRPICLDSITPSDSTELGFEISIKTVRKDGRVPIKESLLLLEQVGKGVVGVLDSITVFGHPKANMSRGGTFFSKPPSKPRIDPVVPVLFGELTFKIKKGIPSDIVITRSSASSTIDSAFVRSVRALADTAYRELLNNWNVKEPIKLSLGSFIGRGPDYNGVVVTNTTSVDYRFATVNVPEYILLTRAKPKNNKVGKFFLSEGRKFVSEAYIMVDVVVDENGNTVPGTQHIIANARTIDPLIMKDMLKSIRAWQYEPARVGNCPVKTIVGEVYRGGSD